MSFISISDLNLCLSNRGPGLESRNNLYVTQLEHDRDPWSSTCCMSGSSSLRVSGYTSTDGRSDSRTRRTEVRPLRTRGPLSREGLGTLSPIRRVGPLSRRWSSFLPLPLSENGTGARLVDPRGTCLRSHDPRPGWNPLVGPRTEKDHKSPVSDGSVPLTLLVGH